METKQDKILKDNPVLPKEDDSALPTLDNVVYQYIDPRIELEHSSSDIICMKGERKLRHVLTCGLNPEDREYDIYKWIPAEDERITLKAGTEGKRLYVVQNRQTCFMKTLVPRCCQGFTSIWETDED